jgi:hypothetical protein
MSAWGVAIALVAAPVASAHHSAAATYAAADTIVVKGTVIQFKWTNPHCHVYIAVERGPFKGRTFTVELGSPGALSNDGWTRTLVRPGDAIEMMVHPSRSGAAAGLCRQCAMTINGTPMKRRTSAP